MAERRYAFVMEVDRCIDCEACMIACNVENQVKVDHHRNWVKAAPLEGTMPNLTQDYVPGNCMHCDNPPCVMVCPTGASYQRTDGLVLIDQTKCIGCQFCIAACPYGARYFDEVRRVVDKCSACVHRLDAGQPPACVETCVGGARHFGDLNDPTSEVAKLVATGRAKPFHAETGTQPQVYYISARGKTDSQLPANPLVNNWVDLRRNLERPGSLGLLGTAVAVTGGVFTVARRNAAKHFKEVETESLRESDTDISSESKGSNDVEK